MKLMIDITIPAPREKIGYNDSIMMVGSCFTGNVGKSLEDAKFSVMYNPTGILFDPLSAARHIEDMMEQRPYHEHDLFELNGLWNSWAHHSEFSDLSRQAVLSRINAAVSKAGDHLQKCSWLMITLGTSYSYLLNERSLPVANCHRAPSQWFTKRMLGIDDIFNTFDPLLKKLLRNNAKLNIVFTVSPVRHIRDGVIENNRSKARLLEAVHRLVESNSNCIYFPAYELVIDVLRDYRFYDADLAHPNFTATQYVFETFCKHYMDNDTLRQVEEVKSIVTAMQHKVLHPGTAQHKQFLGSFLQRVKQLQEKLPHLDWKSELEYFSQQL